MAKYRFRLPVIALRIACAPVLGDRRAAMVRPLLPSIDELAVAFDIDCPLGAVFTTVARMTPPRYIALAGPTASGKTRAAMAIAEALSRRVPVEIVSVDSALVYRGMDIGTAKPSTDERALVRHHLLDLIEPAETYSAAAFVADADRAIDDIHARGGLPLLVGGTMLYFKALFDGIDDMPASDLAVRAQIDLEATARGWPAMHATLAQVDPVTAARLAPADSQRIQRALEVWRTSGRPMSAYHTLNTLNKPSTAPRPPLLSLEPLDRAWLHARIAQRFDAMLAAGFVDEVRRLKARGDLHADLPSMRCVGYRQAWSALDHGDLGPLREQGIAATRQLAKRQITWLRGMHHREVIACDAVDATRQVVDRVLAIIDRSTR